MTSDLEWMEAQLELFSAADAVATSQRAVDAARGAVSTARAESTNGASLRVAGVSRRQVFAGLAGLLVLTNGLLASGVYVHWLTPALGVSCTVGAPTFLLYGAAAAPGKTRSERLGLCVVLNLLGLMVGGLAINQLLPHIGIAQPLGEIPVIITVDVGLLGLGAWSWRRHPLQYRLSMPTLGRRDRTVLILGSCITGMAVVGAVRLNNGAGGGVTLLMLVLAVVQLGLVLVWRQHLNEGVILAAIFLLSLSMLFMTSLRGWYTTGHDVQQEYFVFELTKNHASWDMARFSSPYNASLSITILPTVIWQWARLSDPYIYKVIFQMLFALCPVLVYLLARRLASVALSVLATIYFVSFVTFFQDMPMLNRQEIAFLFLACILLVLFNDTLSLGRRRLWFCVLGIGMVLSHYSTTYVAIGVFMLTWAAGVAIKPVLAELDTFAPGFANRTRPVVDQPRKRRALTLAPLALLVLASAAWVGPLTHTEQGVGATASAAFSALRGQSPGAKSSDTSYNLFSLSTPSPTKLLAEYRETTIASTQDGRVGGRYYGEYYSDQTVSSYPTPIVPEAVIPLTDVGRTLARVGLNVAGFNNDVRQGSAKLLQLLVIAGLIAILFGKRRHIATSPEYVLLAIASMLVVLLQVVLPVLSVDYGLLRAFQQALMVLDIVLVVGSVAMLPRRLGRWRLRIAAGVALLFFISSTGILTQMLGGYGPQLHLNNAGTYYDIYYLHPQEIAAVDWLQATTTEAGDVQPEIQTDPFTFNLVQTFTDQNILDNIYPTVLRRDAYVFLGYATVTEGQSTTPFNGDLLTYKYPLALLDANKDLIYNNGGSRVYR